MAASLYACLRVLVGCSVLLVLLPALVLFRPAGQSGLDRFWRLLLGGVLFWIAVTYLLEFVHDFELLTLAAAAAVTVLLCRAVLLRRAAPAPAEERELAPSGPAPLFGLFLEALDPGFVNRRLASAWARVRSAESGLRRELRWLREPLNLATLAVFLAAFALRVEGPLSQVAPGTSQGYVHLLWTNLLLHSQIFAQGVYPMGLHAVAAVISDVFFLDPLTVLRFLGPIDGLLLVLAVYTLALEISGNRLAALVAAAVFGLGTASPLPEAAFRQITALPPELAAVFVPLGATYAIRFLRAGTPALVGTIAATFAAAALIHPSAPAFGGVVVCALALAAAVARRPLAGRAWRLVAAAAVGAAAGLAVIAVPLLLGQPLYTAAPGTATTTDWAVLRGNPYLWIGVLVAIALLAARPAGRPAPAEAAVRRGLGLALLGGYGLVVAALLGLPHAPAVDRTLEYLCLLLVPLGSGLLFAGELALPEHRRAALLVAGAAVVPALVLWPPRPPQPLQFEPAGAATAFLHIRDDFFVRQWTIVSPVEQYSEVAGRGWHVELADFVSRFSLAQAADPRFVLENAGAGAIATPDVFIYVETTPLGSQGPIDAADLQLPLPHGSTATSYQGQARVAVEAQAYLWCVTYLRAHPDQTSIYAQTATFEVFHIHQQ